MTRLEDQAVRSTRNGIYMPLYPVAEWMVRNWWNLLYEVPSSLRLAGPGGYQSRHNLRFAAEGFALPDLVIQPEGNRIGLEWQPSHRDSCRINFLTKGKAALAHRDVEAALRKFINAVVVRLDEQGVRETFLAEEWRAIEGADADEQAFCRAVGRLGEDPYASPAESLTQSLIEFASDFPSSATDEFLAGTRWADLETQGKELRAFVNEANALKLNLDPLCGLRKELGEIHKEWTALPSNNLEPWSQGYEVARTLRGELATSSATTVSSSATLGEIFGLDPAAWKQATSGKLLGCKFITAAAAPGSDASPYFAVKSNFESGQVFALCRALFEYLTTPEQGLALATDTYSERQKRNRAFAAEFIAPANRIAERIPSNDCVSNEDIGLIAAEFGTSEFVIRGQIQNHGLALIQEG